MSSTRSIKLDWVENVSSAVFIKSIEILNDKLKIQMILLNLEMAKLAI